MAKKMPMIRDHGIYTIYNMQYAICILHIAYTYTYTFMCVCILYIYIYMSVCNVYVCMYVYMYVCMYLCIYVCIYTMSNRRYVYKNIYI